MLATIFMQILDMTRVGSIAIVLVFLARLLLKKVPKIFSYALWAVVLFRLLCPISFKSDISVMPETKPISENYTLADVPVSPINAGVAAYKAVGDAVNGGLRIQYISTQLPAEDGGKEVVSSHWWEIWVLFGQYVWAAGVAVMAIYAVTSYIKLRRQLVTASPLENHIYLADEITSPFVLGLFRPGIYLPSHMKEQEIPYILMHERHHIRRFDHIWKALAFVALCIHWFNPLVWMAFILAGKDMEMSCDEAVVKKMGEDVRADYAASLLHLATGKRIIAGAPLAFGEGDPKGRIRNLANWKKPAFWVILAAVVGCGILAVCLLADPRENSGNIPFELGNLQISWAKALDLRPNEPTDFNLNAAELEELKSQLSGLTIKKKDNDLGGLTPFYTISIQAQGHYFSVQGFDIEGKHVGLYYQGEYYRINDKDFSTYLQRACDKKMRETVIRKLTLEDVLRLSEKGEALTWADFADYESRDIGSGLYILYYEIDERYCLLIGGVPGETPMYMRLYRDRGAEGEVYIEIRSEDVAAFLDESAVAIVVAPGIDAPGEAVIWGKQVITERIAEQNVLGKEAGYSVIGAELTALELIPTGTSGSESGEYLYQLEYRLSVDCPEKVAVENGLRMYSDKITEWTQMGRPHLLIHWENVDRSRLWQPVCVVYTDTIVQDYGTPKMLELYGDAYTAAAAELYRQYGGVQNQEDALDEAIRTAVLTHNWNYTSDKFLRCEDHVILLQEGSEKDGEVTVYTLVLYQEYEISGNVLLEAGGSYTPAALTFSVADNGTYTLQEYWEPESGGYNRPSLQEKFPESILEAALDSEQYAVEQKRRCELQAKSLYPGLKTEAEVMQETVAGREEEIPEPIIDHDKSGMFTATLKTIKTETATIDFVDYITTQDEDGKAYLLKELGLADEEEMVEQYFLDGYYIHNPETEYVTYPLADTVTFRFFDWGDNFVEKGESRWVETTDKNIFQTYLETYTDGAPRMPFYVEFKDGEIVYIEEILVM